jgi:hypothetical protein
MEDFTLKTQSQALITRLQSCFLFRLSFMNVASAIKRV